MKKNESENKNSCANPAAKNETIDVYLKFYCEELREAEAIDLNDDEIEEAEKNEDFEIDLDDDDRNTGYTFEFVNVDFNEVYYTIIRDGVESKEEHFDLEESNFKMDSIEESVTKEFGIKSRKGYLSLRCGKGTVFADIKGIKEFDPKKLKILMSKYVEQFNGKIIESNDYLAGIEYDGVAVDWEVYSDRYSGNYDYVVDVPASDKK